MERSSYVKCPRCKHNMTRETFYGDADEFSGWRCIMCGEIIDRVILRNRRLVSWVKENTFSSGEDKRAGKFLFIEERLKQLVREQTAIS